jgi:beta-phosphoglucomutase-like phosphatase (HAD superfamily)
MIDYEGVIFEMDGTLVDSPLDFAAIRADLGVPEHLGILEALEELLPLPGLTSTENEAR